MSEARFFHSDIPEVGVHLALSPSEARHAGGSRRLRDGDECVLFDGAGVVARARVSIASARQGPTFRIERRDTLPAPSPELWLACALPKGDRQSTLIDMAVQLGVTRLLPMTTERAIVKPSPSGRERLRRVAIEACKQSRRAWVPVIDPSVALTEAVEAARSADCRVYLAHPARSQDVSTCSPPEFPLEAGVALMVGPEGGFTEQEVAAGMEAGARVVALGDTILRIETAAIALLALARWGRRSAQA